MHENSLANLKLWKQGQSGNPRGRSAAGGSIIEWMNLMAEWPEEGIRGVADDDGAPAAKRTAACRWLAAIDADNEKDAREAAAFVCRYTHGRPRQTAMIHHVDADGMRDLETGRIIAGDLKLREIANEFARCLQDLGAAGQPMPKLVVDAEAVVVEGEEDDRGRYVIVHNHTRSVHLRHDALFDSRATR